MCTPGFPWKSSGYWDSALPMQGAQVQSLVGRISHCHVALPKKLKKKKKKKKYTKKNTLKFIPGTHKE